MKKFSKALAVLLSVLMIVFSFPLSAFAKSDDTDVVIHAKVMSYDGRNAYGYEANYVNEYDPAHLSVEQLKTDIADNGNVGGNNADNAFFCLVLTMEGLDAGYNAGALTFYYKSDYITPAFLNSKTAHMSGSAAGEKAVLKKALDWDYDGILDMTGATASLNGADTLYLPFVFNGYTFPETTVFEDDNATEVPGTVLAVVGFELLQDCNLADVIECSLIDQESFFVKNDVIDENALVPYGMKGTYESNTYFTLPEMGQAPAQEEPKTVDYVYTMADGSQKTVTVNEGETPTAPANTADTKDVSNNDGTHTHTTYSWPEFSADVTAYTEVATPVTADCTLVANDDAVAPGHSTDGSKASSTCSVCGYTKAGDVDPATGHTWDAGVVTAATCVAKGYTTYTCTNADCADDETAVLVTDYTEIDPENHAGPLESANNEVASTCHTAGHASDQVCTACGKTAVTGEALPLDPTNHEGNTVDAGNDKASTCITAGYTGDKVCDVCNEIVEKGTDLPLNPENHEGNVVDAGNAKEATRSEDGYTGDKICDACKEIVVKGEVIPALGVMITVANSELGSATLNGEATTGEAQKVAYASDYTLTATANAGAEFVGWMVNGKMVSTDATYTTAAYADTTYAPVFAETENTFTVTFVDVFNNVIAVLSADEVAALTELPAPYAVSGYTFTGYDKTLEEVKALDASTVVTAGFEKNAEEVYNVSAPGCAIYVNGVLADSDSVMVPHDARVAVMPANDDVATSWTVNGAEAAYGEKYTFYVTTDVTVSYSTAEVTVAPTVIAVNGNGEKVEGTNKVRFLASRTVTAGYELVESGFVYGKNVAAEDLTLENVGNGCYLYKNSNMAADGQFALTFGVSNGTACARAYMIVKNTATGETSVVYAAAQING